MGGVISLVGSNFTLVVLFLSVYVVQARRVGLAYSFQKEISHELMTLCRERPKRSPA